MIKTLALMAYLIGGAELHQLPMELSSSVVQSKGEFPIAFTCAGRNVSIPLRWRHIPTGARSLALVMIDTSTPKKRYLWAVYNIPPERHWMNTAAKLLRGEHYAENSAGHLRYEGPCPPRGEEHHYVIRLYALKTRFYFHQKVTAEVLLKAMEHRIIATAEIEARFGKVKKHFGYIKPSFHQHNRIVNRS